MKTNLKFRVADNPGDYQDAHRLMRSEGYEKQAIGFPTILAWEGSELIGICGTRRHQGMIIAGPLVVKTDRKRLFAILRLAEAYEELMEKLGVNSFILALEKGSILARSMDRYRPGQRPYAEDETYEYYTWRVKNYHYGKQGDSPASVSGGEGATTQPS